MSNIEYAVKFMEMIANDDSHGYAQDRRNGDPDYDCSSLVGTALNFGGFNVKKTSTTCNLYEQLICCGFKEIGINNPRLRGDIFLTPNKHVVMCVDGNNIVHASINSHGGTTNDAPGDQTGNEVCIRSFYNPTYGWKYHLRYETEQSRASSLKVGIDVSKYQGVINWFKVKSSGINFAILKIIDKNNNLEESFERNYSGCINANIECKGVYNYSYATSTDAAILAAESVVRILNGRKLIVWLDVEDHVQKNLGSKLIDIIDAYKKVIESNGLLFGLYTGMSFYNSYIKPYADGKYTCWIARYGKNDGSYNETYKPDIKNMICWQYTSRNSMISGINGNVDMNVWFDDIEFKTDKPGSDTPVKPSNTNHVLGKTTASLLNIRTTYNTSGSIVGQYKKDTIVKLYEVKNGWYRTDKGWISGNYVNINLFGKVYNCEALNVRSTPELTNNIMFAIRKNTSVQVISFSEDEKWIKVIVNSQIGWCSKKYIKY